MSMIEIPCALGSIQIGIDSQEVEEVVCNAVANRIAESVHNTVYVRIEELTREIMIPYEAQIKERIGLQLKEQIDNIRIVVGKRM